MTTLLNFNYTLFQAINAPAGSNPLIDKIMIFCANFLIFCLPLLLIIEWGRPLNWYRRSLSQTEATVVQERRATALWIVVACILAYCLNLIVEHIVFEPRPFIAHKVHLLVTHAADASFPSDHTAWTFAVVGMLVLQFWLGFSSIKRQRSKGYEEIGYRPLAIPYMLMVAAFTMGLLIGFARVYVGVHYPGDIVGGAIDGLIAACIVTLLRRWLRQPTNAVLQFAQTLRLA
jgi:undecaprenyl-diphosphatase